MFLMMSNDVVIYQSDDGLVKMEAIVDASNDTIWATQKAMAQLFGVNVSGISRHLVNVFSSEELDEKSNLQKLQIAKSAVIIRQIKVPVSKMETVVQRGFRGAVREMVEFYNLVHHSSVQLVIWLSWDLLPVVAHPGPPRAIIDNEAENINVGKG